MGCYSTSPVGLRPVGAASCRRPLDLLGVRHMAARRASRCTWSWAFGWRACRPSAIRTLVAQQQVMCCIRRIPLSESSAPDDKVISLPASTSAADAFPPRGQVPNGWDGLSAAFRYCASVLDLLGHWVSFLRCTSYRLRGTQQTSSGKTNRLHVHPVATTASGHQRKSGFAAAGQLAHPGCLTALRFRSKRPCTYDFHQTPPRGQFGVRANSHHLRSGPGAPGQRPCHSRCWVPSVRAPGLDSHLLSVGHADRTQSVISGDDGLVPEGDVFGGLQQKHGFKVRHFES